MPASDEGPDGGSANVTDLRPAVPDDRLFDGVRRLASDMPMVRAHAHVSSRSGRSSQTFSRDPAREDDDIRGVRQERVYFTTN